MGSSFDGSAGGVASAALSAFPATVEEAVASGLPVFEEGDEPRPWWIVRGWDAWVDAYWAKRWPVPVKRSARYRRRRAS